jgi:hypothetical protein
LKGPKLVFIDAPFVVKGFYPYRIWGQTQTKERKNINKNETVFLLNISGNKAAKYILTYFLLKSVSMGKFCIQKLFWAISGSQDIDPVFSISKLNMFVLKVILLKYRQIKKDKNSISGYFVSVFISAYCLKYGPSNHSEIMTSKTCSAVQYIRQCKTQKIL